jgi:ABC-type branched-subunit amino acid transport system ATPase component
VSISETAASQRSLASSEASGDLLVAGISVAFEGVKALQEVDLSLKQLEILGIIGPNGAGKTTLLNALTGFIRPSQGSIWLEGTEITGWPTFKIARRGLVRTFQAVRSFRDFSVLENIRLGALATGISAKQASARTEELLEVLHLSAVANVRARSLPFGYERRLGIGRAAATGPKFLLLDEPAAGLNTDETNQLQESIRAIQAHLRCGVLVIEHDMQFIMGLCHQIQVLDYGRTIAVGRPDEIRNNPLVLAAYLGAPDPA